MRKANKYAKTLLAVVAGLMLAVFIFLALADVLMPEAPGTTVKKNGSLNIDCSCMSEGYIMVKGAKSKKKLKLRVKCGDQTLNYDLNMNGEYEVIPLQFGSGKYSIALYKNASGNKYSEEGKISLNVELVDEHQCFLYPNQYVNYQASDEIVAEATKLCAGMQDQKSIYDAVCKYVTTHFVYDYIKMVTVKAGTLPDIDYIWTKKMGICQDLAAVTVCMLRSQGVPARLMIGTVGVNSYHAWVTAYVNGNEQFFDPTAELNAVAKGQPYTTERYY